jgi:hypothetical protein
MKPQNIMNAITKKRFAIFAGLNLALIAALLGTVSANDERDNNPFKTVVTGQSDWSIIPAAFTPQFIFYGTDGDIYIRHMPLVGQIALGGGDFALQGKISADLNGELDSTFSGPLWASITITTTIEGVKTIVFEGTGSGPTVGLVSTGVIKLEGRGPFEGATLEFEFTEIGPGNTDTYNLKGVLIQPPGH